MKLFIFLAVMLATVSAAPDPVWSWVLPNQPAILNKESERALVGFVPFPGFSFYSVSSPGADRELTSQPLKDNLNVRTSREMYVDAYKTMSRRNMDATWMVPASAMTRRRRDVASVSSLLGRTYQL